MVSVTKSKPHLCYKDGWWYLWESRTRGIHWFCKGRTPTDVMTSYNNLKESVKLLDKDLCK